MIKQLICQGVFTNVMGNAFVNKSRNAAITRTAVGKYLVNFKGALGINSTDLDVDSWVRDNAGVKPRVVNVFPVDSSNVALQFYDEAGALTDDFICGFVFSAVEGG